MLFLPFSWPIPLLDTFESVGKMTIPLSMILIGSLLADLQWHELRQYSKNIYIWIAAGCKLFILPLFLFVFLFFSSTISISHHCSVNICNAKRIHNICLCAKIWRRCFLCVIWNTAFNPALYYYNPIALYFATVAALLFLPLICMESLL